MIYQAKESYRKAWSMAATEDPPVPLCLDLELSSYCNARCPFCYHSDEGFRDFMQGGYDGNRRFALMGTDLALRLIDKAAEMGIPSLKFNWRGESTIHPDYSKIVRYASDRKRTVLNFTGAGQYEREDAATFFDVLINSNFDFHPHALDGVMAATKIMVSLDSARPVTHKKIRVGLDFNNVIKNVRAVVMNRHPNVWLRRVKCPANAGEDFVRDCEKVFGPRLSEDGTVRYHCAEHAVFDRSNEPQALDIPRAYCCQPSQRLMISSTGKVFPCCMDIYEDICLGDAAQNSLLDIWQSRKLAILRAELRHAKTSQPMRGPCCQCRSWSAYDHPNRAMLGDKELI